MDISIQERWLATIHFLLDIEYGEGKFKKHHAWLPPFYWIWEGQIKKIPCTYRPLTTAMTDGCTLNPSVQAESTLLGILQQTRKMLTFPCSNIRFVISMFKRVEPPLGEVTVTNQGHWGSCHHFGIHHPPNMEWEKKYEFNHDLYNINTFYQIMQYFQF